MAVLPGWPADILNFYGVYLACGAIVLFVTSRQLLVMTGGAIAIAFVFIVTFDPFKNWDLYDYSYNGIAEPSGFVRNLFFDGFLPVFSWVAFCFFDRVDDAQNRRVTQSSQERDRNMPCAGVTPAQGIFSSQLH